MRTISRCSPRVQTLRKHPDRPTLIIVDSHIAYGAPHKQDTSAAHGEPLGEEEIKLTKRNYGWPEDAQVSGSRRGLRALPGRIGKRGKELRAAWMAKFEEYKAKYPELADQLYADAAARSLPEGWEKYIPVFPADAKGVAGRDCLGARC